MRKEKVMNQNNHAGSNQKGAVVIMVAVSLIVIVGFAALSVDVGRRVLVENEVQNAVDAGALAGASALITVHPDNSTSVNEDANDKAIAAAVANFADNSPVAFSSEGSVVERGHWTFDIEGYSGEAELGFTPNASLAEYNLTNADSESLNGDEDWINAIRVTANTESPVGNFFARIFGIDSFNSTKDAVGYRGFAGRMPPGGVDMPIAMCYEAIKERCSVGRMFPDQDQTAKWTDFTQEDTGGCGNADHGEINGLLNLCAGNPTNLDTANGLSTNNGVQADLFHALNACFETDPQRLLNVDLPVVYCEDKGQGCMRMAGYVNMDIVWVETKANPRDEDAPKEMYDKDGAEKLWPPAGSELPDDATGEERWDDFADHFNLQDQFGDQAEYPGAMKIYFKPSCEM
jgi:hypothetical protein